MPSTCCTCSVAAHSAACPGCSLRRLPRLLVWSAGRRVSGSTAAIPLGCSLRRRLCLPPCLLLLLTLSFSGHGKHTYTSAWVRR